MGHVGEQALAVFEKGAALVREADAPRGAHEQFDAQVRLERVDAPPDQRGRHALSARCGAQAAARGHGDEGGKRLELVHPLFTFAKKLQVSIFSGDLCAQTNRIQCPTFARRAARARVLLPLAERNPR
jgi:hypothetical protein